MNWILFAKIQSCKNIPYNIFKLDTRCTYSCIGTSGKKLPKPREGFYSSIWYPVSNFQFQYPLSKFLSVLIDSRIIILVSGFLIHHDHLTAHCSMAIPSVLSRHTIGPNWPFYFSYTWFLPLILVVFFFPFSPIELKIKTPRKTTMMEENGALFGWLCMSPVSLVFYTIVTWDWSQICYLNKDTCSLLILLYECEIQRRRNIMSPFTKKKASPAPLFSPSCRVPN